MPGSETDNLETHWDAKVGPRRRSTGPLVAIWQVQGDAKGNYNSVNFSIVVRLLDRAVADFIASRGVFEIMMAVVTTRDRRKDLRG
jgi:hypothetical protein